MTWRASVLTLFPEMFPGPLAHSLAGRALQSGVWSLQTVNIRDFATDRHRSVDDTPFGGGAGMVLRPDVVDAAIASVADDRPLIFLTPRGRTLHPAECPPLCRSTRPDRALWPLRRRRPARHRSPWHGRGQHRRLRAVRRRTRGPRPARRHSAPPARRDGSSRQRRRGSPTPTTSWNTPTTRAPPTGRAGASPTCCCPATTPPSPPGASRPPSRSPANAAPTCGTRTYQPLAPCRLPVRQPRPKQFDGRTTTDEHHPTL